MQIVVKALGGRSLTVEAESYDTIGGLKAKIMDREKLVFASKLLDNNRTLAHYQIKNGSIVHVISPPPRPRSYPYVWTHISIKMANGETVVVEADSTDTIATVKAKASAKLDDNGRWCPRLFRLVFEGKQLVEEEWTVADHGIGKDAELDAVALAQIVVVTVSGEAVAMAVDLGDTVESVKERIEERDGINVEEQRVVFDGRVLDDDYATLAECGVVNLSILHIKAVEDDSDDGDEDNEDDDEDEQDEDEHHDEEEEDDVDDHDDEEDQDEDDWILTFRPPQPLI